MFFVAALLTVQVVTPAPPLSVGDLELGPRILLAKGGAKMVHALAEARGVPLDQVFVRDSELMRRAEEIADIAGIEREIVIYRVPAWRDLAVVNVETHFSDDRVVMFVSPLLLDYADAQGRDGMLAHELAHVLEPCGPDFASRAEQDTCEQAVDLRSSRWVGRDASIRGLCQLMASAWHWRYTTDVSALIERITRLHHADIPR